MLTDMCAGFQFFKGYFSLWKVVALPCPEYVKKRGVGFLPSLRPAHSWKVELASYWQNRPACQCQALWKHLHPSLRPGYWKTREDLHRVWQSPLRSRSRFAICSFSWLNLIPSSRQLSLLKGILTPAVICAVSPSWIHSWPCHSFTVSVHWNCSTPAMFSLEIF